MITSWELTETLVFYLIVYAHSKTGTDIQTDLLPVEVIPKTLPQPVLADLVTKNTINKKPTS